jgi:hypothetical protein
MFTENAVPNLANAKVNLKARKWKKYIWTTRPSAAQITTMAAILDFIYVGSQ